MKKTLFGLIVSLLTVSAVHAQQTVVIERPGIFTDLATAIIGVPAAAATGIVQGVAEAGRNLISGHSVVVSPAPVVLPQRQVIVTSPLVTGRPSTTVVTTTPAPVVVAPQVVVQPQPMTSIITNCGNGTAVTITRPASGYELGGAVIAPVAPEHRVGSSPFVNPYVYRHR